MLFSTVIRHSIGCGVRVVSHDSGVQNCTSKFDVIRTSMDITPNLIDLRKPGCSHK